MNKEPSELEKIKSYPDFLKPRLRLFLSADIAGSTAAKQKEASFYKDQTSPRKERGWIDATVYFFEEFSSQFNSVWTAADSAYRSVPGTKSFSSNPPVYWKAIGDEILFFKEISQWEEIWVAIGAWSVAIKKVRHELHNKFKPLGLDIKGSAWIAGFPVINTELVLNAKQDSKSSHYDSQVDFPIFSNIYNLDRYYKSLSSDDGPIGERDFIGPLIDTGFRVSSQATPGRLVISIETAYAILGTKLSNNHVKAIREQVKEFPLLQLYYAGRKQLKGVAGSTGYPLFFVDIGLPEDDLFSSEAVLLQSVSGKVGEQDALNFCEKYFQESASSCRPYIFDEQGGVLLGGEIPSGHLTRLTELLTLWQKIEHAAKPPVDSLPPDSGTTPEGSEIDKVKDLAGLAHKTER